MICGCDIWEAVVAWIEIDACSSEILSGYRF